MGGRRTGGSVWTGEGTVGGGMEGGGERGKREERGEGGGEGVSRKWEGGRRGREKEGKRKS